jgi:hypothetical protein
MLPEDMSPKGKGRGTRKNSRSGILNMHANPPRTPPNYCAQKVVVPKKVLHFSSFPCRLGSTASIIHLHFMTLPREREILDESLNRVVDAEFDSS